MKRTYALLSILFFVTALGTVACGGDTQTSDDSNAGTNNAAQNNSSGNNSSGNNSSANTASCSEVCDNFLSICQDLPVDQATCESGCEQNMTDSERNCTANASTCQEASACDEGGSNNSSGNNSSGNNSSNDGSNGSSCTSNSDCDSEFCLKESGSTDGTCAENDFGDQCQTSDECLYDACLFSSSADDFGYCTRTCDSFTDCPTFWSCEEVSNAASDYCIKD